jgi:hypothetical protein
MVEFIFHFWLFFAKSASCDFTGCKFVLTEHVPRTQSKSIALQPNVSDALVFTAHSRPVQGTRVYYGENMKHCISEVKSGERYEIGIIFHYAVQSQ